MGLTVPLPSREDPRACFIEQLCYSCRVNMKDVVSSMMPVQPWRRGETQWEHRGILRVGKEGEMVMVLLMSGVGGPSLQPFLEPLPPYILMESQCRSQR